MHECRNLCHGRREIFALGNMIRQKCRNSVRVLRLYGIRFGRAKLQSIECCIGWSEDGDVAGRIKGGSQSWNKIDRTEQCA